MQVVDRTRSWTFLIKELLQQKSKKEMKSSILWYYWEAHQSMQVQ